MTRSHPKHAHKPAQHKAKADKKGKNFRQTSRKLSKEVSSYRPDLKVSLGNATNTSSGRNTSLAIACTSADCDLVHQNMIVGQLLLVFNQKSRMHSKGVSGVEVGERIIFERLRPCIAQKAALARASAVNKSQRTAASASTA